MYPFGLVAGVYPAAVAEERLVYFVNVALVCATSWSAAACWAAVGGPDGTGAITIPFAMVVAPLTFEQTDEVVCAVPVDPVDDDEFEPAIDMPAIDFEPSAVVEPPLLAAAALAAECDEASDTVVAARTSTAATPTVARPTHHNLAAVPMDDTRCDIFCLRLDMADPS